MWEQIKECLIEERQLIATWFILICFSCQAKLIISQTMFTKIKPFYITAIMENIEKISQFKSGRYLFKKDAIVRQSPVNTVILRVSK